MIKMPKWLPFLILLCTALFRLGDMCGKEITRNDLFFATALILWAITSLKKDKE